MAKPTPGPWTIVRYGDGDSLVIHSDDANRVCFMATPGCRDQQGRNKVWREIKANAHLIASTPELKWFAEQIFNGLDTGMLKIDTPADETLANVLRRGRAALKAAKGEP